MIDLVEYAKCEICAGDGYLGGDNMTLEACPAGCVEATLPPSLKHFTSGNPRPLMESIAFYSDPTKVRWHCEFWDEGSREDICINSDDEQHKHCGWFLLIPTTDIDWKIERRKRDS